MDGLSEDLNLVHDKPYTEMPDSDGMRSESELADIWWENHLKRDRSVIQALFTGQFKSVTSCKNCDINSDCATAKCAPTSCGYSSARYEPFNFLTVPIPENVFRLLVVYVIPLQANHSVHCAVRAPKMGTLFDVAKKIEEMNLPGTRPSKKGLKPVGSAGDAAEANRELYFIAAESVSSRIRSFYSMDRHLDTVKDSDSIVFFQVRRPIQFAKAAPTAAAAPDAITPAAEGENVPNPLKEVDGRQDMPTADQLPFDPESLYYSSNNFEPQSLVSVSEMKISYLANILTIIIIFPAELKGQGGILSKANTSCRRQAGGSRRIRFFSVGHIRPPLAGGWAHMSCCLTSWMDGLFSTCLILGV